MREGRWLGRVLWFFFYGFRDGRRRRILLSNAIFRLRRFCTAVSCRHADDIASFLCAVIDPSGHSLFSETLLFFAPHGAWLVLRKDWTRSKFSACRTASSDHSHYSST